MPLRDKSVGNEICVCNNLSRNETLRCELHARKVDESSTFEKLRDTLQRVARITGFLTESFYNGMLP